MEDHISKKYNFICESARWELNLNIFPFHITTLLLFKLYAAILAASEQHTIDFNNGRKIEYVSNK